MSSTADTFPVLAGPVPPEKLLPLFRFLKAAKENVLNAVPRFAYEQPISEAKVAGGRIVLVADPVHVKYVLLDNIANYPKAPYERRGLGRALGEGILVSDGEKWRAHRKLMSPSFDHRSIVSYAPGMVESIDTYLRRNWEQQASGSELNIADEMTRLTLKIISRAMFSTNSDDMSDLFGETLRQVAEQLAFDLPDAIPLLGRLRARRRFKRIDKIFTKLNEEMYALIDARAKAPSEGNPDLLDRLISARDSDSGQALTNQEVRDEVVIIFVAGHETTAVAMTFVFYLLSQHPKEEAKLHAELDSVLGGRAPTYEDLANLPYTKMVVEESMRLYPPAPGLSIREAQADDWIGNTFIKKKNAVIVLPWVMHRHRALWNNPDRFEPERFSPERSAGRPRFAYMPFGGGPRICIGAALAMTEAQLILATIAQRYRLKLVPKQDIRLLHRVTLRPKDGIRMTLERRS